MKRFQSTKAQILPAMIAISIVAPVIAVLSVLYLSGIGKYFIISVSIILLLLFWISGIRQIKSGKNWLLRIEDGEFEFDSPENCSFTLLLDDIAFISVGGTQRGNSKKYTTYIIHTVNQEEIILPKLPWDMFPIKTKLKKLGVKFKSKKE